MGAPARGGMLKCHSFRLQREVWAEAGLARRKAREGLAVRPDRVASR
jgi:hypothetical protein